MVLAGVMAVSGCVDATAMAPTPMTSATQVDTAEIARRFTAVLKTLEPVAERECRRRTRGVNCDFQIGVWENYDNSSNAYTTIDEMGRPVISFTPRLIAEAKNADEIAFVMAHEAAHHIGGHLVDQRPNAASDAPIYADLSALTGVVGPYENTKYIELEADALGAVITLRAGYDPLLGAEGFSAKQGLAKRYSRSHPPNAERWAIVQRIVAEY